jgi:hypothetical protein
LHWKDLTQPSQVLSHCVNRALQSMHGGHQVVTPSQMICPASPGQLRFAAEQETVPVGQLIVVDPQITEQAAFVPMAAGRLAISSGTASVARNA